MIAAGGCTWLLEAILFRGDEICCESTKERILSFYGHLASHVRLLGLGDHFQGALRSLSV
jgi:hypothetical protein